MKALTKHITIFLLFISCNYSMADELFFEKEAYILLSNQIVSPKVHYNENEIRLFINKYKSREHLNKMLILLTSRISANTLGPSKGNYDELALKVGQLLIEAGAEVNCNNLLINNSISNYSYSLASYLLMQGAPVDTNNAHILLSLTWVNPDFRETERLILAEELLKLGMNPNARASYGTTPLWHSIATGNYKMAQLLLAYGANPDFKHEHYKSARSLLNSKLQRAMHTKNQPKVLKLKCLKEALKPKN